MRSRLALAAAGAEVELREIVLRAKPDAMLAISPKGTVPVLQLADGRVIDESIEVMHWALDQADPMAWRRDEEQAEAAALIEQNDGPFKHWLDRYKYFERFPEHDREHYREQAEAILGPWNARLERTGGGLLRAEYSLADYALLPFVRQFAHSDDPWFAACSYPQLRRWLADYESSDLYRRIMPKWPLWQAGTTGPLVDWSAAG